MSPLALLRSQVTTQVTCNLGITRILKNRVFAKKLMHRNHRLGRKLASGKTTPFGTPQQRSVIFITA